MFPIEWWLLIGVHLSIGTHYVLKLTLDDGLTTVWACKASAATTEPVNKGGSTDFGISSASVEDMTIDLRRPHRIFSGFFLSFCACQEAWDVDMKFEICTSIIHER